MQAYLKDNRLPQPALTVLNCLWWDVARSVAKLGLQHAPPTLVSQEVVQEYVQDLESLLQFIQTDNPHTRIVLHTAAALNDHAKRGSDSGMTNAIAAQFNAAMRVAATKMSLGMIDLAVHVTGMPAEAVLRDYLHPQPWVLLHLFNQYLQCLE